MPESVAQSAEYAFFARLCAAESAATGGDCYTSPADLAAAPRRPDAIIVETDDPGVALEWLGELRADAALAFVPTFLAQPLGVSVDGLVDGIAVPADVIARTAATMRDLAESLPEQEHPDPETRVLAYLYLRPDARIEPVRDWSSRALYRYPLLGQFLPADTDSLDWAAGLQRRGLLEPVSLVDRIKLCPACDDARLSFVDVCTECKGIDIHDSIFLHCHACGCVSEQDRFLIDGNLSCPKCHTRLRHIGVDYDRALESMSCSSCAARFIDPAVLARCLSCGASNGPDALTERRIHTYRLSADGRHAARTGRVDALVALTDHLNFSHPAYFRQTLDWLIRLQRRHAEIAFAVACLRFDNLPDLTARLPRVQVIRMLDTLALRLRELMRSTDLIMRADDRHCWLLLPQTPAQGATVFLSRVKALSEATRQPDGTTVRLAIAHRSAEDLGGPEAGAEEWMRLLEGSLGSAGLDGTEVGPEEVLRLLQGDLR